MCVILKKDPEKGIPYNHLLAASIRNEHGYGVVIHDGSRLINHRGYHKGNPDKTADAVAEILDKNTDKLAFVHLRLKTQGEVCEENIQPIPIIGKDKGDETDIFFMHNGSLDSFRDPKLSDSVIFARDVVEPLVRRSAALLGEDAVLKDPLLARILSEYSGWSRFALVDSFGSTMIIGETKGADQPYGWSSNTYSLDPKIIEERDKKDKKAYYPSSWPTYSLKEKLDDNKYTPAEVLRAPINERATVHSTTGLCLKDLHGLSQYDVEDLVDRIPQFAALLILDLVDFHYRATESN